MIDSINHFVTQGTFTFNQDAVVNFDEEVHKLKILLEHSLPQDIYSGITEADIRALMHELIKVVRSYTLQHYVTTLNEIMPTITDAIREDGVVIAGQVIVFHNTRDKKEEKLH